MLRRGSVVRVRRHTDAVLVTCRGCRCLGSMANMLGVFWTTEGGTWAVVRGVAVCRSVACEWFAEVSR